MALLIDLRPGVHGRGDAAQRDAVIQGDVVAHLGRLANHHAHAVVNEEAFADLGAGMDFDAGEEAPDVRQEAAKQSPASLPGGVRKTIDLERVEAGITQKDLEARLDRRITVKDNVDLFAKSLEHAHTRRLLCCTHSLGSAFSAARVRLTAWI